jgi:hypothetical protein
MRSSTEEPQKQEQIMEHQQQRHTSLFYTWTLNNKNKSRARSRNFPSNCDYYSEKQQQQDSFRESNNNTLIDISTSDNNHNNNNNNNSTHLSKVAIHTTIKFSSPSSHQQPQQYNQNSHPTQQHPNFTSVHPPVITQYPPIPLKYSPVEPLLEVEDIHAGVQKPKHHLSLLRLSNEQQQTERRNSDSQIHNENKHIIRHGIGRQWNRLLFNCGIKKT